MAELVLGHVTYPRLNPARRQFALGRALDTAEALSGDEALLALLTQALQANHDAIQRMDAWKGRASRARYGAHTKELMHRLARIVGSLMDAVRNHQRMFPPGSEARAWADQLADEALPLGASGITRLPYMDQIHSVMGLLRMLEGEAADAVAGLGLGLMVQSLADVNTEAFDLLTAPRPTYASVRTADDEAVALWLRVVARLQGIAATGDPADVRLATSVFRHIEDQRVEMQKYRARRRRDRSEG